MKAIRNLIVVLVLLGSTPAFSQTFDVPQGYGFTTAEDYTRYEKDIIAAAKWLESTPLEAQPEKRKQTANFIYRWVNGSPTVMVSVYPCIMDFEKANPGMLALYMAACSRYALENNYSKDKRAAQAAALRSMMKLYQLGTGVVRDKKMEKLIKTDADGKLDKWLEKNMPTPKGR